MKAYILTAIIKCPENEIIGVKEQLSTMLEKGIVEFTNIKPL